MVQHALVRLICWLIVMTATTMAHAGDVAGTLVREQHDVAVRGEAENWQLVWDGKPQLVCGPTEVFMAITCPCAGLAYGEYGKLSLVRKKGDREIDRMDLRPLFGKSDYPEADKISGTAWLQRWPLKPSDAEREDNGDPALVSEIEHRAPPTIMHFADYDHNGAATEFLIQVGTLPCGDLQFAAVGVSAGNPHLHALSSVENPTEPLIMPLDAWQALLKGSGPQIVPAWQCGNHGSEVYDELVVSAAGGTISVKERSYSCESDGRPGKLIKEVNG